MKSPYGAKEEIKMRLDMLALISEYTSVKKSGASWMAICPFHNENTPSLHVSPDKGVWYCHGCGEGGDVFAFVMSAEGMDFGEAFRHLAKKAGVEISENETKEHSERQSIIRLNTAASKYYREYLRKSSGAEKARNYVSKRGINEQTQEEFMIGYSPEAWENLIGFFGQKGVRGDVLYRSGLASKSNQGKGYYDRFRDRLMFPISDHNGNVVGFTARVLPGADGKDPKDTAKYLNTTQTAAYSKSAVLYGLHLAKKAIKEKNQVVVVEGNMDVVMSHQAGVRNVVGSSGTAFTPEQLRLLKRFTDRIVLSFDADAAGETAARRSIDACVAAGFAVRVLRLPEGAKDPDDCIKQGASVWEKAIGDAQPYMAWYMSMVRERTDFRDPDAVSSSSSALAAEIAKISSPVERAFWVRDMASLFDVDEAAVSEAVRAALRPATHAKPQPVRKSVPAEKNEKRDRHGLVSEFVVAASIAWPEIAKISLQEVSDEVISDDLRSLYSTLRLYYTAHESGETPREDFAKFLSSRGMDAESSRIAVFPALAEKAFGRTDAEARKETANQLIGEIKLLHKSRQQKQLKTAMAHAERAGDLEEIDRIGRELSNLMS